MIVKPYPGVELEFVESTHTFKIDGERVPGVTSITGIIDKSRPLIYWAVGLAREHLFSSLEVIAKTTDAQKISDIITVACEQHKVKKDEAATSGTKVHQWVQGFIEGKEVDIPSDPEVKNGITAFLKWVDSGVQLNFSESEKIVYSKKYNYAGILDAVGEVDGKSCLIDFKTSNAVYPEMILQVAAYANAYEEMTGNKIKMLYIARFDKATGEFHIHKFKNDKKYIKAFVAALTLKKSLSEIEKELK